MSSSLIMGDLLSNREMLKKLGFDSSNHWIIYDEQFDMLFNFLSENITDSNILTVQEWRESVEMQTNCEWVYARERSLRMKEIESNCTGLLSFKITDIDARNSEISRLEEAVYDYLIQLGDMQHTKHIINKNMLDLDIASLPLLKAEDEFLNKCQIISCKIENIQRKNFKFSKDANMSFIGIQVPPLLVVQQPLEQFFRKCDSFMLFIGDNFKMQQDSDFVDVDQIILEENCMLENLQNTIQYYTIAYIEEITKSDATQVMIEGINQNLVHHCISSNYVIHEAQDFQVLNENHLKKTFDNLQNALNVLVQLHIHQSIELIIYENTKQKVERALRRNKHDKKLARVTSHALSNAELIWISTQLDLEKNKNCSDSSINLCAAALASLKRVQAMRSLNATSKAMSKKLLQQLSNLLSVHLDLSVCFAEDKNYLYEYEKFCRLSYYALQSMRNTKIHMNIHEQLVNLNNFEQTLWSIIFDAPLEQPMLQNLLYLCTLFSIANQQQRFEDSLRILRVQFKDSIIDRMDEDYPWRFTSLLWVWFLTDPQRMLNAISEVKKIAANISALTFRPVCGFYRK